MHLRPMLIVEESNDKSTMTYLMGMGTTIPVGVYIWLLEGASKKVLIDTGCSADFLTSIGFQSQQISTQEEELAKAGLTPDDIDMVILTHLHVDHARDAGKFGKAVFVVQRSELEFAAKPHPIQAGWFASLPEGRVRAVDGDEEILEGIRVLHTPGHTPGTQSVLIESDKGPVCLSGQCTIMDNVQPPDALRQMGVRAIAPGIHINAAQGFDSLVRLQQLGAQVLPLHDISYRSVTRIP